jgi:anti-sigma regulatory factor (Ser/Thr protein kinase)
VSPAPASLSAVLDAPAAAESAQKLRARLAKTLADWGLEHLADRVVLAASELLTNALLHGRATTLTLLLEVDGPWLRLSVPDANPAPPYLACPDTDDENHRGVCLIAAFADAWGFRSTDTGKHVFAEFLIRPDTDEEPGP